jgi:hypothetical protein
VNENLKITLAVTSYGVRGTLSLARKTLNLPVQTHCNTKKILERCSGVDQKFDFLNRCSDGRSETADAKI